MCRWVSGCGARPVGDVVACPTRWRATDRLDRPVHDSMRRALAASSPRRARASSCSRAVSTIRRTSTTRISRCSSARSRRGRRPRGARARMWLRRSTGSSGRRAYGGSRPTVDPLEVGRTDRWASRRVRQAVRLAAWRSPMPTGRRAWRRGVGDLRRCRDRACGRRRRSLPRLRLSRGVDACADDTVREACPGEASVVCDVRR